MHWFPAVGWISPRQYRCVLCRVRNRDELLPNPVRSKMKKSRKKVQKKWKRKRKSPEKKFRKNGKKEKKSQKKRRKKSEKMEKISGKSSEKMEKSPGKSPKLCGLCSLYTHLCAYWPISEIDDRRVEKYYHVIQSAKSVGKIDCSVLIFCCSDYVEVFWKRKLPIDTLCRGDDPVSRNERAGTG